MKQRFTIKVVLAAFILLIMALPIKSRCNQTVENKLHPSFRYVILGDSVDKRWGKKLNERLISILLEEEAFSEETLKTLSQLVFQRFPHPERLTVIVYTSLKQVRTPEEENLPRFSNSNEPSEYSKYPHAL